MRLTTYALLFLALFALPPAAHGAPPASGPDTEQRFPPLVLPPGFHATLFACDPLVEYPSVIALGPRPGTLFVAHDYMTGLGTEIVRRDEIRLLRDTDGDGYADDSTLYAGEFNSIQGIAFHDGTVWAMHAPLLTSLRDNDGDGVADQRQDLLSGLGLTPEQNSTRLHCANGVTVGHDGWLYLSLGDNGVDVPRPEGDRLVLHGGGILRCRRDGRDLHVFSTGLRNIYDVALDDQLNVFVRDNENDGGDYMIRVCHSFHGADHGYPYLYYERPDEALPPLADLGRGSSAGGVCYRETAFPPEMHGSLFFCEWGRAVVYYGRQPATVGFDPMQETDFAAGAPTDPYGFNPTDVVVDRDGSLLISDWGDGQRPKRGRGRIYRIAYAGGNAAQPARGSGDVAPQNIADALRQLDATGDNARSEAHTFLEHGGHPAMDALRQALDAQHLGVRARQHAVWLLAQAGTAESLEPLLGIAASDPDSAVRAQAVRAIADLTDPVLVAHRLDAGRGDAEVAARLAALAPDQPPAVLLEIIVALGRLRWEDAPRWLGAHLTATDPVLFHAALQTLRRCDNWPEVLKLLDEPDDVAARAAALRATAACADATLVAGLIERLEHETQPTRRRDYAAALARVYKRPGPWVYWGYRPGPRPANSVAWEQTDAIADALDRVLHDADLGVRAATLQRMQREQVPTRLATLSGWLREDRRGAHGADILRALKEHPFPETRTTYEHVLQNAEYDANDRLAALEQLVAGLGPSAHEPLLVLAGSVEDGPVLARLIGELATGAVPAPRSVPDAGSVRDAFPGTNELLLHKLNSLSPAVRAAAMDALARLEVRAASPHIPRLLHDEDPQVRRAAAAAAGRLHCAESADRLLELVRDPDPLLGSACLDSLRRLKDPRAVPVAAAALEQPTVHLAALDYLAELGNADYAGTVVRLAANARSSEVLTRTARALELWRSAATSDPSLHDGLDEHLARLQGDSGVLVVWNVHGPLGPEAAAQLATRVRDHDPSTPLASDGAVWTRVLAEGADARIDVARPPAAPADSTWLACSDVFIAEPARVQFLASGSGALQLWVDGRPIHQRDKPAPYQPDSDRFEAQLDAGRHRLLVQMAATSDVVQLHARFRRLGSSAEHERLAQFVLQNTGNVDRGREVFLNADKSLCSKCHRIGDEGPRIGPDLSGIGSRFSRIHLIESILEPSRAIAPSYETVSVALTDGRVLSGVKVTEDESTLTLADDQGRTHALSRSEIDERRLQPRSTMPDGLEKRLSDRELLDLVSFLAAEKTR